VNAILSGEGRTVIDALAHERALLVFDFDGTLAPIVECRECAEMRPSTHALLRVTALLYPCAIVSGRARADLVRRVVGVPLLAVVGNHGAEAGFGPVDRTARSAVVAWREALAGELRDERGVEIEDKGLSLAIHYRGAPRRAAARHHALAAAESLAGVRIFGGRCVVNVAPAGAPDKGSAVAEILRRIGWRSAVYVGDDATDEEAFGADAVGVSIRIGRSHRSAARWYLPQQRAIDDLLARLVLARRRLDGGTARIDALVRAAEP
jgi:trehalose 6-phosphate phosphatase